jgi:diaminohydroxyphosphoribosylaminopyrimidine deaminase / 5-amino-6-(5-phosphoribosylamino)uracil reductase
MAESTERESELALHERHMRAAIGEAERARGSTGDNPWVGCVIVDASGQVVATGHTQGPGEDHAEIVAMRIARQVGADLARSTMYSTLEPCSFHGRTPACSRAVIAAGVPRIVTGIRDPNPRVDGVGIRILKEGGMDVVEDVCAAEVTRQLAPWIFRHHPHEPLRRARAWLAEVGGERAALAQFLSAHYGLAAESIESILGQLEPSRSLEDS